MSHRSINQPQHPPHHTVRSAPLQAHTPRSHLLPRALLAFGLLTIRLMTPSHPGRERPSARNRRAHTAMVTATAIFFYRSSAVSFGMDPTSFPLDNVGSDARLGTRVHQKRSRPVRSTLRGGGRDFLHTRFARICPGGDGRTGLGLTLTTFSVACTTETGHASQTGCPPFQCHCNLHQAGRVRVRVEGRRPHAP